MLRRPRPHARFLSTAGMRACRLRRLGERGRRFMRGIPLLLPLLLMPAAARAAATYTVAARMVADQKAVFATVESRNVVAARTRIGGTVTRLAVKDGDHVNAGQVIATIRDQKLQLQIESLDAEIVGLRSQLAQAQIDLARAEALARSGTVSREQLDRARTAVQVATSTLNARIAQRAVAEQHFVLRLLVPERHALHLQAGDTVRLDGRDLGESGPAFGTITLVYPRITAGQVQADATAPGIGQYFVGERIRVWIPAGKRRAIVVPASFVFTRFGQDYVR